MIVDTSALYAFFVSDSPDHWAVAAQLDLAPRDEPLVISPFAIVELEGVILSRFGVDGWLAVLSELGGGAWSLASHDAADLVVIAEVVEQQPELPLAVVSGTLLARREGAGDIASVRAIPA